MSAVYWRGDEAPADERPLPDRVDVAVIGAGFAGLSIALDLLRPARTAASTGCCSADFPPPRSSQPPTGGAARCT